MTWELTKQIEEQICSLLVQGNSFRKIGRMDNMPSRDTLMRWERENPSFAASVACAREAKQEDDAEELEEINELVKAGTLGASEATVISNNIKWTASRMLPKKYGDKIHQEHSGAVSLAGLIAESQKD